MITQELIERMNKLGYGVETETVDGITEAVIYKIGEQHRCLYKATADTIQDAVILGILTALAAVGEEGE